MILDDCFLILVDLDGFCLIGYGLFRSNLEEDRWR